MRLSKLARKLEISPSELLKFFTENKVGEYASHNNKITEEHIDLAIQHHKVEMVETEQNLVIDNRDKKESADDLKTDSLMLDSHEPDISEKQNVPDNDGNPAEIEEEIEVIRMPKIKLKGVKVVGKIDLPEPVKKSSGTEIIKSSETEESGKVLKPDRKKRHGQGYRKDKLQSKSHTKGQNRELSYEEKLKRQEQKRIREQKKTKRLRKVQKKHHYLKNVQSVAVQPIKKKKHENIDENNVETINARPQYKNPIRKLWAWLNGEFDKY